MSFGMGFQEKLSGHLVALYYFIKLNEKNKVNLFSSFKKKLAQNPLVARDYLL
jgi:hypothetical protein